MECAILGCDGLSILLIVEHANPPARNKTKIKSGQSCLPFISGKVAGLVQRTVGFIISHSLVDQREG